MTLNLKNENIKNTEEIKFAFNNDFFLFRILCHSAQTTECYFLILFET